MQIGRCWDDLGRSMSWLDFVAFVEFTDPGSNLARALKAKTLRGETATASEPEQPRVKQTAADVKARVKAVAEKQKQLMRG